MINAEDLQGTGIYLRNDPFLVKGFQLVITNRSGYGGYYHDELDWDFHCYGTNYESLINNIAPMYFQKLQDNKGTFQDFEMDRYDIYTARFVLAGDQIFIDEDFEDEDVDIDKTPKQVQFDIENSPAYLALMATK